MSDANAASGPIIYGGYKYRVDHTTTGHQKYVRCAHYKCKARGKLVIENGHKTVEGTIPHDICSRDDKRALSASFIEALKKRAKEDYTPLTTIYDEMCHRFPGAREAVAFHEVRDRMLYARRSTHPQHPQNLQELGDLLDREQWKNRYGHTHADSEEDRSLLYQGTVRCSEAGSHLFFATAFMLQVLASSLVWHADASFKVLPAAMHARQLLVISCEAHGKVFPCVYVMMSSKTEVAYKAVFEFLRSKVPHREGRKVITDFERGLQNAIRHAYPDIRILGCWFHYCQAVFKKFTKLGLLHLYDDEQGKRVLKMTMSLPLLPATKILEGLNAIQILASSNVAQMTPLLEYVRKYWVRLNDILSVWNEPHRTNNAQEIQHRWFHKWVGQSSGNVFLFLDKLGSWYNKVEGEYRQTAIGNCDRSHCKTSYLLTSRRIQVDSAKLELGQLSTIDFLLRMSHSNDTRLTSVVAAARLLEEVDDEDLVGSTEEDEAGDVDNPPTPTAPLDVDDQEAPPPPPARTQTGGRGRRRHRTAAAGNNEEDGDARMNAGGSTPVARPGARLRRQHPYRRVIQAPASTAARTAAPTPVCPVCKEDMSMEAIFTIVPCGHSLCPSCKNWMDEEFRALRGKCPVCRSELSAPCVRVHF